MEAGARATIGRRIGYFCIGLGVALGIMALVQILREREGLPLLVSTVALLTIGTIMVAGAHKLDKRD